MNSRFKHAKQALDFYGVKVDLNFQSKLTHKTCFGSIISVLMVILFSLVCYVYGKEIIEKKKPIVVSNERFVRNPQRMDIDKAQQTFMMGYRHQKGFSFYDPSLFQVSAQLYTMQNLFNATSQKNYTTMTAKKLNVRQCTINDIKVEELKGFFNGIELNTFVCFDDNQEVFIEGDISGDYYTRVEVYFKQCQNSTTPGSVVCAPQEKLDSYLKIAHFVAYIIDKLVDPTNLEKPFEYQGVNLYSQCSNKLSKEVTAYFSNYYIQSDLGIINEDIQEVRDFIYSGLQETNTFEDPQIITKFVIRPVKNRETVLKRRYMKISDLIAQLGGLLKLIAVIGSIVTIPFAKFHLNKEIVNNMFDFNFDEKDQFQDSNQKKIDIDTSKMKKLNNKQPLNQCVNNIQDSQRQSLNINNQQFDESNNQSEIEKSNKIQIDQKQIRLLSPRIINKNINPNNQIKQQMINDKINKISQHQKQKSIYNQLNEHQKQLDNQTQNDVQTQYSPKLTDVEQNINNSDSQQQQSMECSNSKITNRKLTISEWAQEKVQPVRKLINFSILEQFQYIMMPFSQKIKSQKPFIDLSIQRINQHLDIQFMLNKFQEVDKLKQILLTEDQIKLFELVPRPTVERDPSTNEVKINSRYFKQEKTYDEKYQDAQTSLQNILSKDKKSQRDLKLIELLDPNLLSFVESDENSSDNIITPSQNLYQNADMRNINDEVKETYNNSPNLTINLHTQQQLFYNKQPKQNSSTKIEQVQLTQINNTKTDNDEDEQVIDKRFKYQLKYNKNSLNL